MKISSPNIIYPHVTLSIAHNQKTPIRRECKLRDAAQVVKLPKPGFEPARDAARVLVRPAPNLLPRDDVQNYQRAPRPNRRPGRVAVRHQPAVGRDARDAVGYGNGSRRVGRQVPHQHEALGHLDGHQVEAGALARRRHGNRAKRGRDPDGHHHAAVREQVARDRRLQLLVLPRPRDPVGFTRRRGIVVAVVVVGRLPRHKEGFVLRGRVACNGRSRPGRRHHERARRRNGQLGQLRDKGKAGLGQVNRALLDQRLLALLRGEVNVNLVGVGLVHGQRASLAVKYFEPACGPPVGVGNGLDGLFLGPVEYLNRSAEARGNRNQVGRFG